MGTNNKARRAAKAKQRQQRRRESEAHRRGHWSGTGFDQQTSWVHGLFGPPDPAAEIAELWDEMVCHPPGHAHVRRAAEGLTRRPEHQVDACGERIFIDLLADLWSGGWQPAELRRHVRHAHSALAARLVEVAILAFHDRLSGVPIDPRWSAQLAELSQRTVSTHGSWLRTWRHGESIDRPEAQLIVGTVLYQLAGLPPLDVLIAGPGVPADSVVGVSGAGPVRGDPMLNRIRRLLTKAESTEFEEEATALTAKAQELMTRYAIDHDMLSATADSGDRPRMIRIPVDAPYADAKSSLLSVVAGANRCRAVSIPTVGLCSVFGFPGDLALVEMLFTSLLIQAQHALAGAAREIAGVRARRQSFRASFFLGFADRIGERLETANAAVIAELPDGNSVLPVLRSRDAAVDDFLTERYGDSLVASRVRGGWDPSGIGYGRMAADRAKLNSGELVG